MARPQFLLLLIGQTVSQLGDRLHNMALFALVDAAAATSTAGVEVSKIAIVTALPTVFAPVIGALVDRWSKRATMILCDIFRTMVVAIIPFLYHLLGYIWPAYVVAFFVGLAGVFFNAAKMSLIPDLVQREELLSANAALTTIGRIATVTGIVGGGFMVGWTFWRRFGWEGYEAGFYMDSLSYAVSVLTLTAILILSAHHARRNRSAHPIAESAHVVRRELKHLAGDMRTTWSLIRTHHGLRFVFLMVIILGLLAGSLYGILTAAALAVLKVGPKGIGILGGLLAGGMILGGLLVGVMGSRWDKRWMTVVGCLLMGLLMIGCSFAFQYAVFLPVAFLGGAVLAPVMVSMDTLLHESAPADSRGLVFSTRDTVLGASFMLFSLVVGVTAALLRMAGAEDSYAMTLGIFGILAVLASVGAALTQRRRPGSPGDVAR